MKPSTDEGDWVCDVVVLLHQVAKSQCEWILDHALDGEFPMGNVFVFDLGNVSMIPDVEELRACEEAFVVEI